MKSSKLIFVSLLIGSLSLSAFALSSFCGPGICTFSSLNKAKDTAEFYCDASGDATTVHFQNHNVDIGGFDKNGELTLNDGDVSKLKTYYFKVSVDPDRSVNTAKTVTFNSNGKIKCNIGKGGRKLPFNGLFKAL